MWASLARQPLAEQSNGVLREKESEASHAAHGDPSPVQESGAIRLIRSPASYSSDMAAKSLVAWWTLPHSAKLWTSSTTIGSLQRQQILTFCSLTQLGCISCVRSCSSTAILLKRESCQVLWLEILRTRTSLLAAVLWASLESSSQPLCGGFLFPTSPPQRCSRCTVKCQWSLQSGLKMLLDGSGRPCKPATAQSTTDVFNTPFHASRHRPGNAGAACFSYWLQHSMGARPGCGRHTCLVDTLLASMPHASSLSIPFPHSHRTCA